MTQQHPDLAAEQAYIDHAYDCLERSRTDAWKLRDLTEAGIGVGGTFQARYERDVFDEALVNRLTQLDLGGAALVFGRIDRHAEGPDAVESFHIGRLAIADEHRDPVVIDWRAPVAEPFYRATGRESMGLLRRRHFAVKGRKLLGLEDELFGEGHLGIGHDEGLDGEPQGATRMATSTNGLQGYSTLLESLERGRTGHLGDIVATIQGEQDEIIRSPQAGVLIVQGGPGTGKTVVALHRAAYLLYTYRFPLEDQGVLVIGPNRVFLRYIEQVLPSLGEAGVEQVVLSDLVDDVVIGGREPDAAARVKGDARMSRFIENAVRDRERPLRNDLIVPFGATYLRLRASESSRIVKAARRRGRRHNATRRVVESEVWSALAASSRDDITPGAGPRGGATPRRGPRCVRVDVAGAHTGRAAPRPLRLQGSHPARRQRCADRGGVRPGSIDPVPPTCARFAGPPRTSRSSTTRAKCSDRVPRGRARPRSRTRSARSGTS